MDARRTRTTRSQAPRLSAPCRPRPRCTRAAARTLRRSASPWLVLPHLASPSDEAQSIIGLRGRRPPTMRFGVFDHIEPVPGQRLDQIYRERLVQIERLDTAGFYTYHLAEHHTPAVHSLAPSQNVFLAAVAQRTRRLRFGPCVYVLPLHHPLRL